MAVGGVGGLFGQLINPGLDMDIARQMTPNPNPLAQQGPGGVGPKSVDSLGNAVPNPSQQPPLAPGAFTQPDPVNASYNANLIKAAQRDAYGADLNRNIEGIAAGFGTAQQQASKQAALRGGGGVGGSINDLMNIQKMQETTIADNEHARYMANITVLAQRMGVTPAEITEMSNTEEGRKQIANVLGGNLTATDTIKNADAATRAYADAHPNATKQEIEDFRSSIIAGGMGGADLTDRQYLSYAAAEKAAGRVPDDLLTWKAHHVTEAKEADATAINISNAKKVLPGVNAAVGNMSRIADSVLSREDVLKGIFENDTTGSKRRWIVSIMSAKPEEMNGIITNALQSHGLSTAEAEVLQDVAQLHNMNYRGAFAGEGGVKGIRSQVEAERVSRAADQLANFTDLKSYLKNLRVLKGTYGSAQANAAGEAQAYDQIPENVRRKLDESYFEGGVNAPKDLPEWAKIKTVNSQADWDKLPQGQAYRAPGSAHGNKILIKGHEQDAIDEEDNG